MTTAKEEKALFILDVMDEFSYEHYPVFVLEHKDLEKTKAKYNSMQLQRVYEVIPVS